MFKNTTHKRFKCSKLLCRMYTDIVCMFLNACMNGTRFYREKRALQNYWLMNKTQWRKIADSSIRRHKAFWQHYNDLKQLYISIPFQTWTCALEEWFRTSGITCLLRIEMESKKGTLAEQTLALLASAALIFLFLSSCTTKYKKLYAVPHGAWSQQAVIRRHDIIIMNTKSVCNVYHHARMCNKMYINTTVLLCMTK